MTVASRSRVLGPLPGRSPKKWSRVVLVCAATLAPVLLFTSSAGAAGNPVVARYIVPRPVPGWSHWPKLSNGVVAALEKGIGASDPGVLVAADGWVSTSGELAVALVVPSHRFPYVISNGVEQGCEGVVHSKASSVNRIPGVAKSGEGMCARKDDKLTVVEAGWIRGGTIAVVEGIGLSEAAVNKICRQQDALLPSTGIHVQSAPATTVPASTIPAATTPAGTAGSPASSGLPSWALLGAGVLIVALAVGLVLFVRSRRSKPSIVTPAWTRGSATAAGNGGAWDDVGAGARPDGPSPTVQQSGFPEARPVAWQPGPVRDAGAAARGSYGDPSAIGTTPVAVAVLPEPSPAPGWHPVGGDPHLLRYWDGSAWTALNRWDGQSWIDQA